MSFHKGNYNFKNGFYMNTDQIREDIEKIRKYGDISSVRKVCKIYEVFLQESIEVIISEEKQRELDEKEQIKKFSNPVLNIRNGKFLVYF